MKINLIDINGLGFAAMYAPSLSKLTFNGESTAALHGAVASVFTLQKEFPDHIPVVLWDGRSHFRKAIHPGYKANRVDTPEKQDIRQSYSRQSPYIRLLLTALGIPQIASKDCEADDIAGWLCSLLPEDTSITLSTKDSDWWQALAVNTCWYNPLTKKSLTFEELSKTELGDGPFHSIAEYVAAKSLSGDASDGIDGIPKVGMKTALKILRKYDGSIEALWKKFDEGTDIKGAIEAAVASPQHRDLYRRNVKLIDWSQAPAIPAHTSLVAMERDDVLFNDLCEQYGLTRLARQGASFEMDPKAKAEVVRCVSALLDPAYEPDRRIIQATSSIAFPKPV